MQSQHIGWNECYGRSADHKTYRVSHAFADRPKTRSESFLATLRFDPFVAPGHIAFQARKKNLVLQFKQADRSSVGETVIDVPPALSARVRLLDAGRKDKTDAHDARSAAIVALRHRNLHAVTQDNHVQVLRLLARRHHQLIAGRTRAICRLHALLVAHLLGVADGRVFGWSLARG